MFLCVLLIVGLEVSAAYWEGLLVTFAGSCRSQTMGQDQRSRRWRSFCNSFRFAKSQSRKIWKLECSIECSTVVSFCFKTSSNSLQLEFFESSLAHLICDFKISPAVRWYLMVCDLEQVR